MTKHKDPLLEALKEGKSFTWTAPDGGDFASMRKAIKHGQTLTMSPVVDPCEVQVGDIVLVVWHKGYLFHMVGEIQGDQFLIVNSLGKANGWVSGKDILGRITKVIDPEPHSSVPVMLAQLSNAYQEIIQLEPTTDADIERLFGIIDDLRWYADRIGRERWDTLPRSNKWSFEQHVWHLTRQAMEKTAPVPDRIRYFTDRGKICVGAVAEIFSLLEYD